MVNVPVASIPLPELLKEQVIAAQEAGFYTSETELLVDAIRTLLAARPDIRLGTACRLYERGAVSLGKAAELAGVDIVSFKHILAERGISRVAPESLTETVTMVETLLRLTGRST